jgi:hypothetical protein
LTTVTEEALRRSKNNAFISTEKRREEDRESIKTEPEARRRRK